MKKNSILLVGAGGHAEACIDVIEKQKKYQILGNVGFKNEKIKSTEPRISLFKKLKKLKFNLPVIKSPHSIISRYSEIGEGTIIMHGAIIGANVKIGKNCIINSNSLIEHGSRIGDNTHIATSVTINSGVTVNANNFVGSNSTVKQKITIGKNSLIGMDQAISKNCPPNSYITKKNEKK